MVRDVRSVLFILAADVFEDVAVCNEIQFRLESEWARVILRVLDLHLQVHMSEVAAVIVFSDPHRSAAGVPEGVEPTVLGEPGSLDNERVALPFVSTEKNLWLAGSQ